ncbi:hypothetical protein DFQ28_003801 [Apophysomyces sp. BC1034]|nr:hypothetical protein DFQ30_000206 [Apophysomyces sp. BC1015]KAG0178758.1 hypothetical protein DFQ29_003035 [Apophysomyces sp. BC1021]KAG0189138.1 hypothetical protein DFQ28_003801 [Apophysomyces sp. BC1034]
MFLKDLASRVTEEFSEMFTSTEEEDQREEGFVKEHHRYDSFAPVRHECQVKYFVDGQDYCWAVAEAIENANESIFIEDWWLTPELYLRRPPAKYPEYRVDALLKRKAEQGVKIYIVVYKEVEMALTLDSAHTKHTLQALHENIVVQRHPDHAIGGTFFWSHHEKFVIVDNRIAFLGGIDLCFGRWDTHAHRLADFHAKDPSMELFPGQDYSDARVRDFEDVKNWDMRLIDKTVVPRMPWHDMSLCVIGGPVLDVARHFCERWNFVKHEKALKKEKVEFLQPPLGGYSQNQRFDIPMEDHIEDDEGHACVKRCQFKHGTRGVNGTCRAQVLRSSGLWSLDIETEHSIQNAYIATIYGAQHYVYIENQFFITAVDDDKDYILKNQIGSAIVRRIVRAHEEQTKFKVIVMMPLMPAFPADLSTKEAATARLVMHFQYMSICRGNNSIVKRLEAAGINPDEYIRFYSLRSYDRINRSRMEEILAEAAGFSLKDQQLANAGQSEEAQKAQFVKHVGNPDFVEGTEGEANVEDEVEYARVPGEEEAEELRENYRKRLAELQDGDEGIASDSIAQDAMEGGDLEAEPWVGDTETSQPRDEEAEKEEASDYVSEELYIHAKLLIADDRTVIMGSSNLNDRSQCGDRDSEIALLVEDQDLIPSKMDGRYYEASRFAATLRRQLWKEHLGMLPDRPTDEVTAAMLPLPVPQDDTTLSEEDQQVMDPLDDETLAFWNDVAKTNTEAFREVFHCVPDDNVTNWEEYKEFYPDPKEVDIGHVHDPEMSVDDIRENLGRIRGHLVEFPYKFLENVDLAGESIPFISNLTQELYT